MCSPFPFVRLLSCFRNSCIPTRCDSTYMPSPVKYSRPMYPSGDGKDFCPERMISSRSNGLKSGARRRCPNVLSSGGMRSPPHCRSTRVRQSVSLTPNSFSNSRESASLFSLRVILTWRTGNVFFGYQSTHRRHAVWTHHLDGQRPSSWSDGHVY